RHGDPFVASGSDSRCRPHRPTRSADQTRVCPTSPRVGANAPSPSFHGPSDQGERVMSATDSVVLAVVVVVVVLVVVAIVAAANKSRRRRQLREQFGPEYDRTVDAAGKRSAAERDLAARAERRSHLNIRSLSPEERATYSRQWDDVQAM